MFTPPIQPAGQPQESDESRERARSQRRAGEARRQPAAPFGLPPPGPVTSRAGLGERCAAARPARSADPGMRASGDSVARVPPVPRRPRPGALLDPAFVGAGGGVAPEQQAATGELGPRPHADPAHALQAAEAADTPGEPRVRRKPGEAEPSRAAEAARSGADDAPPVAETTFAPVGASTEAAPALLPPPGVMDRVVEFARLSRTSEGLVEFTMGLKRGVLGGVRVRVVAYGQKKVGLRISGLDRRAGVGEDDVAGLVEALHGRGIEVVEVATA